MDFTGVSVFAAAVCVAGCVPVGLSRRGCAHRARSSTSFLLVQAVRRLVQDWGFPFSSLPPSKVRRARATAVWETGPSGHLPAVHPIVVSG